MQSARPLASSFRSPSLPDNLPAICPERIMPNPLTAKIRLYICGETPNIFCRTNEEPEIYANIAAVTKPWERA
ncbi:hypothetical protein D3C76_1820190 [compost metagenome]